jgi:ABC-type glycerol-3-phosphate transport system permease component
VLTQLQQATRDAVAAQLRLQAGDSLDPSAQIESATAVLINRLAPRVYGKLWDDPPKLLRAFAEMLTDETIRQALDDRTARFELRGLLLRTLDGRIIRLWDSSESQQQSTRMKDEESFWRVASGPAELHGGSNGAVYLQYHFDSPDAEPVVLECDLDVVEPMHTWHRLTFSFKADNSWHRIQAMISGPTGQWHTTRTNYAAQNRVGSIIFQFPSFEDQMLKARTWTPLEKKSSAGEADSTLRIIISPSSTLQAIAGKVQWNYSRAFRAVPFWTYVGNSLLLVGLCTVGTLFSSTFVAYAFARLNWPGRGVALVILLSTMMLPGQVTMIPSFMIWRQLGWYNTLNPLWVPAFFGSAFFIFLMVQHMKTIPKELEEAARIDGLSAMQTWWYVIVPLVKPAAAAIAIMTVMGAWNEFMGPLIYLRDQTRFPLSLGLFAVRLEAASDWTMIMAGNVLMTLPMIVMFILFQRYFIQGMTMGGLKG